LGDLALLDELLHRGVVDAQLAERPAVPAVDARVADVERHPVAARRGFELHERETDERGARDRAREFGAGSEREYRLVGTPDRVEHDSRMRGPGRVEDAREGGDGGLAGAVAEGVPSHAVRDDEERWRGEIAVFVEPAHGATIG